MSEFSENNKNIEQPAENAEYRNEYDEFQTIFADPEAHNDKPKANKKKRILAIIAACAAVAVLVGGTISVINLIPKLESDKSADSVFDEITVLDVDSEKFNEVTVKNAKGGYTFKSEIIKTADEEEIENSSLTEEESTSIIWHFNDIDDEIIDYSVVEELISAASSIKAKREITQKGADECGFDKPSVEVQIKSEELGDFKILVGAQSPDGTGTYLKLSNKDNIYLVDEEAFEIFNYEELDFAKAQTITPAEFEGDLTGYLDEDGRLTTFDSIEISGSAMSEKVVIEPNTGKSDTDTLIPYFIKEPVERYGDEESINLAFAMFTGEIVVEGAYSFDVSEESLASVGLDNPHWVVTLNVGRESKTFKISKVSEDNYALVNDDSVLISKVNPKNADIAAFNTEDYYSYFVSMYSLSDIKTFTMEMGEESLAFDITYDGSENAEEPIIVEHNDEKLTASYFQKFYQDFVGLSVTDYSVSEIDAEPYVTFKLRLTNGKNTSIEFYKSSESTYQYRIDDVDLGKVTMAALDNVITNLKLVAQNKPTN